MVDKKRASKLKRRSKRRSYHKSKKSRKRSYRNLNTSKIISYRKSNKKHCCCDNSLQGRTESLRKLIFNELDIENVINYDHKSIEELYKKYITIRNVVINSSETIDITTFQTIFDIVNDSNTNKMLIDSIDEIYNNKLLKSKIDNASEYINNRDKFMNFNFLELVELANNLSEFDSLFDKLYGDSKKKEDADASINEEDADASINEEDDNSKTIEDDDNQKSTDEDTTEELKGGESTDKESEVQFSISTISSTIDKYNMLLNLFIAIIAININYISKQKYALIDIIKENMEPSKMLELLIEKKSDEERQRILDLTTREEYSDTNQGILNLETLADNYLDKLSYDEVYNISNGIDPNAVYKVTEKEKQNRNKLKKIRCVFFDIYILYIIISSLIPLQNVSIDIDYINEIIDQKNKRLQLCES